jgi:hypothetical protein
MPKYKTKLYWEKEARMQEAFLSGKKPRGRKRKIKAINTQMIQRDIYTLNSTTIYDLISINMAIS